MSTIRIPLNSRKYLGLYALIDEADYELVSHYRWWPSVRPHSTYVYTQIDGKTVYLQRLLIDPQDDVFIDHINSDGLDNRRENLRLSTPQENSRNKAYRGQNNKSGFVGVHQKENGRWGAYLYVNRRPISLGIFDTPREAALTRDAAAIEEYGEFATLNFPVVADIKERPL